MKRTLKIILLSFLSLLLLCIITVALALWLVFTPERLTPLVQKQLDKQLSCQSELGSVGLTFFSSFPHFSLEIDELKIINPMEGAPCDTLLSANKIIATIDINAYRKENTLILNNIELQNASICAFVDSTGKANFDITKSNEESSESSLAAVILEKMTLENCRLQYFDESLKLSTKLDKLSANLTASLVDDSLNTTLNTSNFKLSLAFENEQYLQEEELQIDTRFSFDLNKFKAEIYRFTGSLNAIALEIKGTAAYETETGKSTMDLSYRLASTPISEYLKLVPKSQEKMLDGIDISGLIASEGKIKGVYQDSIFPWIDARLSFHNGLLRHSLLPLPLEIIKSEFKLYTNLQDDKNSYLNILNFEANTPKSSIKSSGWVRQLFSDISIDFNNQVSLSLAEFNPMIPKEMKAKLNGRATGSIKSTFLMSQLENMDIEKMKLSGDLALTNFAADYDSLSLSSDRSKFRFEMPYAKAKSKKTRFAFFELLSENLHASKIDDFNAKMQKMNLKAELSNVLDSTRTPNVLFSFSATTLKAKNDEMTVALKNPSGTVDLSPQGGNPKLPYIKLAYRSNDVEATMDKNRFVTEKIETELSILHDPQREDLLQQWLPKGQFKMGKGNVLIDSFPFPIEISGLDLKSDREKLIIERSILKVDNSDLELSGVANNLKSYLKGDSTLRAEINVVSNLTNLSQLMALTDGLGSDDYAPNEEDLKNNSFSGPYMIPQKIDVLLHASVKKAIYNTTVATNIYGDLRVKDGLLVLDELKFSTPAADMQVTAMYRTPRKNHLFVGMDLHLLDIEIKELLELIPDLDSIMPMLRSFEGNGEFHLAVETYLDSLYNPKMSTLRGISSIQGEKLVLMDGETFSEIAKKLHFNKKTKNKIDSLSAQFTIFRDEVDVYPFLIVMDKYKAIVSGRHNLDLSYDYHISVVQSPLPFRLGLNVNGNGDDLKFKIVKPQYSDMSRPAARKDLELKQLQLRKKIQEELSKRVTQKE